MKVVKFVSSVDPSKCNGDKLCEKVCRQRHNGRQES